MFLFCFLIIKINPPVITKTTPFKWTKELILANIDDKTTKMVLSLSDLKLCSKKTKERNPVVISIISWRKTKAYSKICCSSKQYRYRNKLF